MKTLFIGDIVGRAGRQIVIDQLPDLRKKEKIDWVIANAENLAGGRGINQSTIKEITAAGVDVVTGGNHIFRLKEGIELLNKKNSYILRPANYPPDTPGRGWKIFTNGLGQQILVINLIGRVGFREDYDCPFRAARQILHNDVVHVGIKIKSLDGIFIDFHAEATSEKSALGHYLAGQVTAIIGTHTHIPTCDEKIINDTAFITDVGMTGPIDSVLGVEKDILIKQFLTQLPQRFMWKTSGPTELNSVIIKTKKGSSKALSIKRINVKSDI